MKDISAVIIGLIPAFLLWQLGVTNQHTAVYFLSGLAAIALCLVLYYLLNKWRHGGLLVLLTLGIPPMCYVYIAVRHAILTPLFLAGALLAVLAALVGSLIGDNWSWQGVGINLAFFCTSIILIVALGSRFGVVYAEAGLLAAVPFGITRLCHMDLLSWLAFLPRWIYRGMENIWH